MTLDEGVELALYNAVFEATRHNQQVTYKASCLDTKELIKQFVDEATLHVIYEALVTNIVRLTVDNTAHTTYIAIMKAT